MQSPEYLPGDLLEFTHYSTLLVPFFGIYLYARLNSGEYENNIVVLDLEYGTKQYIRTTDYDIIKV